MDRLRSAVRARKFVRPRRSVGDGGNGPRHAECQVLPAPSCDCPRVWLVGAGRCRPVPCLVDYGKAWPEFAANGGTLSSVAESLPAETLALGGSVRPTLRRPLRRRRAPVSTVRLIRPKRHAASTRLPKYVSQRKLYNVQRSCLTMASSLSGLSTPSCVCATAPLRSSTTVKGSAISVLPSVLDSSIAPNPPTSVG